MIIFGIVIDVIHLRLMFRIVVGNELFRDKYVLGVGLSIQCHLEITSTTIVLFDAVITTDSSDIEWILSTYLVVFLEIDHWYEGSFLAHDFRSVKKIVTGDDSFMTDPFTRNQQEFHVDGT